MPILSIAIQKGGSGKTTTAINLSAAWQQMGKKVLLIDLDPQANCTQALGLPDDLEESVYQLFREEAAGATPEVSNVKVALRGFDFIASSLDLASADLEFAGVYAREKLLQSILAPLEKDYDLIVLDCPPSMGVLTVNALVASDFVLMPLQAEFLPMRGVHSFIKHFNTIQKRINPKLSLLGFVLTLYDSRKNISRNILESLETDYPDKLFDTRIRRNVALVEAQQIGLDIFSYDKNANGAIDYMALAKEIETRLKS
jgi:chromosome partitioning protein